MPGARPIPTTRCTGGFDPKEKERSQPSPNRGTPCLGVNPPVEAVRRNHHYPAGRPTTTKEEFPSRGLRRWWAPRVLDDIPSGTCEASASSITRPPGGSSPRGWAACRAAGGQGCNAGIACSEDRCSPCPRPGHRPPRGTCIGRPAGHGRRPGGAAPARGVANVLAPAHRHHRMIGSSGGARAV